MKPEIKRHILNEEIEQENLENNVSRLLAIVKAHEDVQSVLASHNGLKFVDKLEQWFESNRS